MLFAATRFSPFLCVDVDICKAEEKVHCLLETGGGGGSCLSLTCAQISIALLCFKCASACVPCSLCLCSLACAAPGLLFMFCNP
jgi:hypothetical protein